LLTGERRSPPLPPVDHLVWGGQRLEREIARFERWTGTRAEPGGRHPGERTHNALIGLGTGKYLELIAPDPDAPAGGPPRWFGLDGLATPHLVGWAVKTGGLDRRVEEALAAGIELGEVREGRRERAEGGMLAWRLTYPRVGPDAAIMPFLIDWGDGPHPADTAPAGVRLVELRGEHPEPLAIAARLRHLGVHLEVTAAAIPALVATLETPRGRVELR
jgi:hypothetical protein